MANNNLPTSPHLQVYRLPMTAMLSILHRATGAMLSAGLFLTVLCLLALAHDQATWEIAHTVLSHWFGQLVLLGFTLALNYHMCNGIRHLFWDIGYGFSLEASQRSSIIVLIATIVLTAAVWAIALMA